MASSLERSKTPIPAIFHLQKNREIHFLWLRVLGCGNPLAAIADVTTYFSERQTISTTSDVTATSIIELKPVLETTALDYLPVYGSARNFLFNYTTHNFEGALLSFGHLALDLSPLGLIGRGGKAVSFAIDYGPDAALKG